MGIINCRHRLAILCLIKRLINVRDYSLIPSRKEIFIANLNTQLTISYTLKTCNGIKKFNLQSSNRSFDLSTTMIHEKS